MIPLVASLLEALAAFFKWKALSAQISVRRQLLDELDKIEKEITETSHEIEILRSKHDSLSDNHADRLREQLTQRTVFRSIVTDRLLILSSQHADSN